MIIGITGKKRSGKDTIADRLVEKHGFEKMSLAEPMKEFAMDVFGWDRDWVENEKETICPESGISYRQFLQWLGTDAMQFALPYEFPKFEETTGRKVWINRLIRKAEGKTVVVSDVRFLHEAEAIKSSGGIIARVERPGLDNADNHSSETEMDSIKPDFLINNTGSVEDLNIHVDYMVGCLKESGVY